MPELAVGFRTTRDPEYGTCGGALWIVQFYVTSRNGVNPQPDPQGANGWVVQKIEATYDIIDCNFGNPDNPNPNPYVYYEAFPVGADGNVPVSQTSMDNWDVWNFVKRTGKRGTIKTVGSAAFHASLQAGEMPTGGVPNTGNLRSSFVPPAGLGRYTLVRQMSSSWNCCGTDNGPSTGSAEAKNVWETYREKWTHSGEREKTVDGQRVE